MPPVLLLAFGVGFMITAVGGIMLLVAAFREHVLWGLAYLFVPIAALVFVILHWEPSKRGVVVSFIGAVLMVSAILTAPDVRAALAEVRSLSIPGGTGEVAKSPSSEVEDKRREIEAMEAELARSSAEVQQQFTAMTAKRAALQLDNAAAVTQFNEEAAEYQKRNRELGGMQQRIAAANQELVRLLDARTQRRVVMYTTSTCGACIVAKRYFAQKGISYEEIDVGASAEGRAEFARLGGRGVPLILIGDERVEGFNAQQLDAML